MALGIRSRTALTLAVSLALAPAAHAERWHDGNWHHDHHSGGNAAGAAIIGGLVGLGVGAAIASGGSYYAPPPVYYGAPSGYYYAPPPPSVYYGYYGYYGYDEAGRHWSGKGAFPASDTVVASKHLT